jgi:phage-related protein
MPQFIDAVTRILPLMPDLVRNMIALQQAAYPLIPLFLDLLTKMAPHIPQMIQLAAVIAQQLLPPLIRLSAVVIKMVAEVNKAFQLMYDKLVGNSIIPDLINGIDRWFGKLPEMISGWVGQAKDWAIGKFQELIGWVSGLPGMIVGALGNMGSLLGGVGRDLIVGLWNGMVGMWQWFRDSIYNFFAGIMPQWVKDALGIASPSKLFAAIGKELPAGLAIGMDVGAPMVEAASKGLAAAAVDAFPLPALVGASPAGEFGGAFGAPVLTGTPRGGVTIENLIVTVQGVLDERDPMSTRRIAERIRQAIIDLEQERFANG